MVSTKPAAAQYRFTLLDTVSPGAVKELREMIGEIMVNSAGGGRQLANLGGARHAADILNLLRLVDETVRAKFFTNMSSRTVDLIKEELTNGPPLRRSEALAAQNEVVAAALRLAGEGRIVINSTEELI